MSTPLTEEEQKVLARLKADAARVLSMPDVETTPAPEKFVGPIGLADDGTQFPRSKGGPGSK